MTATLVATPDPTNAPPRVQLALAGATGAVRATITRNDGSGPQPVRSANPAVVIGGAWNGFDYEAPFNIPVTYTATLDTGSPAVSSAVTVAISRPWLIHPGIPSRSMPITVSARGPRGSETNQGVHKVLGRAMPVVVSDGSRSGGTFDLTALTNNLTDEAALRLLLSDSAVLLLQITYAGVARAQYAWVSIGTVTETDVVDWFGNEQVFWAMPCTVTDAPIGLQQAQWTWSGLLADFATWADELLAYATWGDVLIDNRI